MMKRVLFFSLLFVMMITVSAQAIDETASIEVEGKTYTTRYDSHEIVDGQLEVRTSSIGDNPWATKKGIVEFRNDRAYIPVWMVVDCGGKQVDASNVTVGGSDIQTFLFECSKEPENIYVYINDNYSNAKMSGKTLLWSASQQIDEEVPVVEEEPVIIEDSQPVGIQYLLAELNEPIYKTTLEMLRSDEPIRNGSQGDAVRGVQTLLNEFGKNLPLTGGFYNMSLAALQDVERVFGMDNTDYVDDAVFEQLLINLQAFRKLDNLGEDEIIYHDELGISWDQEAYLKACAWEMKGKFYNAYQAFYQSGWNDYETRMEACVQKWPTDGEIYHNPSYYSSGTTLQIIVGKDDGQAMLIKIMRGDTLVSALFLGKGTTVTASLPAGTYTIKTGVGETWFGLNDAFGEDGYYETLLFDNDMREVTLDYGYDYTLRLNFSGEADPDADDVGSEPESFKDF
ncbi:MAG: hypothetical protein GX933_10555 [Chloroflexi bacterium]|nr:hypothetical protein [Chloroflexota bacterium]